MTEIEWIDIKKHLPPDGQYVLIVYQNEDDPKGIACAWAARFVDDEYSKYVFYQEISLGYIDEEEIICWAFVNLPHEIS